MSYVNRVGEAWHGGGRDYANVELLAAVGKLSNSSVGIQYKDTILFSKVQNESINTLLMQSSRDPGMLCPWSWLLVKAMTNSLVL